MFNPHIKFEMSTITCTEEMKGNARCNRYCMLVHHVNDEISAARHSRKVGQPCISALLIPLYNIIFIAILLRIGVSRCPFPSVISIAKRSTARYGNRQTGSR